MAHFGKNTTSSTLLGLDVKVHTPEAFHNKMTMTMMAQHHNHHHRPLSSSPFENDSYAADDDGHGPTAYMSFTNHINLVSALAPPAPARLPLQPFDISPYTSPTTTFKSSAGGMAASLFPFTSAQWRELERQAMIYKYMMASVPVPPDLLNLIATSTSHSPCMDGGFNLRLASNSDPEPGRCRRTDGKKWRCSRDVAPNHKYCERHMHRGRPRSRKPVEVHTNIPTPTSINNNQQIKRARHESNPFPTPHVTVPVSHPTSRKDGSSSHFLASSNTQPFPESSLSLANFGVKSTNFDSVAPLTSNNKEPRGLDWMLNGDPISLGASDSEWQSLMHDKVGMSSESSCNTTEPQYLNSYALYSSGMDQHNRRHPFLLNPLLVPENLQQEKPRGFIDAWSNSVTDEDNDNTNTTNKNSAASIGKLSLSSLDLSMGGGAVHEDIGTTEMGLGNKHTDTKKTSQNWLNPAPWVASTPGGPLAEVLRSSTLTATNEAASNASSPATTHVESNSPLGTMVSSPSGVLPKTLGSLSDCSSNSSPRVASSRASSEMAFLRFQSNVN